MVNNTSQDFGFKNSQHNESNEEINYCVVLYTLKDKGMVTS
jgi:hypothetical protein